MGSGARLEALENGNVSCPSEIEILFLDILAFD
jgi:hypothetical protein